ncbi:hypothetical protein [Micromonospora sp. MW-13]|uniref:hypothetical protein n=1 Tax=Micromonospora sp. MW-13 TaxID=2094022 RepID=UPI000FFE9DEB|nr:hypothetical protein [Micromonospora sp. MW-13]
MFMLPGGVEVSWVASPAGAALPGTSDGPTAQLDTMALDTSFAYVLGLGEDWTHTCTGSLAPPGTTRLGPSQPPRPYRGWGSPPDQYGRHHLDDDVDIPVPRNSSALLTDLAAIRAHPSVMRSPNVVRSGRRPGGRRQSSMRPTSSR